MGLGAGWCAKEGALASRRGEGVLLGDGRRAPKSPGKGCALDKAVPPWIQSDNRVMSLYPSGNFAVKLDTDAMYWGIDVTSPVIPK